MSPDTDLETKIKNAPHSPGVYIMKDDKGLVIYVGKARDLKTRIRAYFSQTDSRTMIPFLVSRIQDIEFILTQTEKEALILENNLIKQHRPRYNVDFRDDKSFYHLRIDSSEEFPHFQLVRRPKKDGARYFGPYPSGGAARETLRFLQSIVPLRTCRDREMKTRRRPCLEYEMGRCSAPCVGLITPEEYKRLVKDGVAFLEGRTQSLLSEMRVRMNKLADDLRFEEAAVLRDRIASLNKTLERQQVDSMQGKNRDVFGVCRERDMTQINLLYVRDGKITGQKAFGPIHLNSETGELISSLMIRYYDEVTEIPDEVIVPVELEDAGAISEWLGDKRGRAVRLFSPRRGEALSQLKIALRNAENALKTSRLADQNPREALRILKEKLSLGKIPERIECFDISNIGGTYAVGSLVAFTGGLPDKKGYRRFRIRTVSGADDFAMMYEVLCRRYEKKERVPDLIVVDGGKGQLGVAIAAMKDLQIEGIDLIGLAKERTDGPPSNRDEAGLLREGGMSAKKEKDVVDRAGRTHDDKTKKSEDRVFIVGRKDPIYLSRWPSAFFLLQRIRDEAHRFAIDYHRRLRRKASLESVLDEIPGVGPSRKKALLVYFGDLKKIREASPDELMQVDGIGRDTALSIRRFLENHTGTV